MRALGDAALKRVRRNGVGPMVWEIKNEDGRGPVSGWFSCPYAKEDEDRWMGLIVGIFGVRQEAVAHMFMAQLAALCDRHWKAPRGWHTDEIQMSQLLSIVESLKPRNAAEAALAAQLCALHLSTMKLASSIAHTWGGDGRTAAVMAKTTRAFADGLMALEKLKGRGNKSRQTIKVEKHTHTHQHIHVEREANLGGQAHAKAAGAIAELRSLPGTDTGGESLPLTSGQEQARLPNARRRRGDGGAQR